MSQVLQLVTAYERAWGSDWNWLSDRVALELGSGVDAVVPHTLLRLGARVAYATDVDPESAFDVADDVVVALRDELGRRVDRPPLVGDVDMSSRLQSRGGVTAESVSAIFGAESIDLIVSTSTLEHVSDPERAVSEMNRALRPGGRMVHAIAMGNHCCGAGESDRLAHLVYSERIWNAMFSRRVGHNRLRWFEWEQLFERAGLRISEVDVTAASEAEVEAIRPRLAARFRDMTAAQLAPSYVVVCCEKS